jgi:hypothetical protein
MTNDEIGERGRLARSFRRPAEKLPMVSREARDTAGEVPALPVIRTSEFSGDIPPAFVPQLRDYGLAGDFPPSLRYGAAGARNDKNGM